MRLTLIMCLALLLSPLSATPLAAEGSVKNIGPDVLKRMNAVRAQHGLHRLKLNRKLTASAGVHARNMLKYDFFSHDGPGTSTPGSRARSQGYRFCRITENIAQGQKTLDIVFTAWMNSPKHRHNILDSGVTEFSLVWGPGDIWVMELGRRGC
jgi:uncharacterized protein YkwD